MPLRLTLENGRALNLFLGRGGRDLKAVMFGSPLALGLFEPYKIEGALCVGPQIFLAIHNQ